jgi:hypothetical protein
VENTREFPVRLCGDVANVADVLDLARFPGARGESPSGADPLDGVSSRRNSRPLLYSGDVGRRP